MAATRDATADAEARIAALEAQLAAERAVLAAERAARATEQAALAALTIEHDHLRLAYQNLQHELALLRRRLFAAKAERLDTAQLELEFATKLRELDGHLSGGPELQRKHGDLNRKIEALAQSHHAEVLKAHKQMEAGRRQEQSTPAPAPVATTAGSAATTW